MSFSRQAASLRILRTALCLLPLGAALACGRDGPVDPDPDPVEVPAMAVLGGGSVKERFTAEVWVHGNIAYTSTWGSRQAPGNAVKIWDVSANVPVLRDSLIITDATTLGDIQVSDDGKLLVVATEPAPFGSIVIYDLTNPLKPQLLSRFSSPNTAGGVHTAEIQRVNGKLYAFLSIDPSPARLTIVDLSVPTAPVEVYSETIAPSFIHDVFVRNGILFTAIWNRGVGIYDIGGVGSGTPSAPVRISETPTFGGSAHNIWWYRNSSGAMRYAFVGQEIPGAIGSSSAGDIHVLDVSNLAKPVEVAFFHVAGAGTHNFSVDEGRGILYAAFYNGGVRAIDITGDLGACNADQKSPDGRCDLGKMGREKATGLLGQAPVFVWGVHFVNGKVYASDMLNGLWTLGQAP